MSLSMTRRCALTTTAVLGFLLCGCGSTHTTSNRPLPFQVLNASIVLTPDHYSGTCGTSQDLTLTGTLHANANSAGGSAHYTWTVGSTKVEGDADFSPGQTSADVKQKVNVPIPVDADQYVPVSLSVSTPNKVAAQDVKFLTGCTVPFAITAVSVTMQPWEAGCGTQTFGWAALIEAPPNNAGGTVHYSWYVKNATGASGDLVFAPGQTNQVVTIARTFDIVGGGGAPLHGFFGPTPSPGAGQPTPTSPPQPGPTATPTATPNAFPVVGPGGVYARLTVNGSAYDDASPNIRC